MIEDVDGRFDDYSFLPMAKHMLLHWGCELVENDLQRFTFCSDKNELLLVK